MAAWSPKLNLRTLDRDTWELQKQATILCENIFLQINNLVWLHFRGSASEVKPLRAIFIASACVTQKQTHKQKKKSTCSLQAGVPCHGEGGAGGATEDVCVLRFGSQHFPFGVSSFSTNTWAGTGTEANPFAASRSLNDMQTRLCDSFPAPIWMFYELLGDICWHNDTHHSVFFWSRVASGWLVCDRRFKRGAFPWKCSKKNKTGLPPGFAVFAERKVSSLNSAIHKTIASLLYCLLCVTHLLQAQLANIKSQGRANVMTATVITFTFYFFFFNLLYCC